jgi:hypothetical protein
MPAEPQNDLPREQRMSDSTDRNYSELGELLDTIACKRNVRGPYLVAKHLTDATGCQMSGQEVSRLLYGESYPRPSFIAAFAQAFGLSIEERDRLAFLYTYGELQDGNESTL